MKYFKQETGYTCGCACFRMIISAFSDDIPDEQSLIKELSTNDKTGTLPGNLIAAAKSREFEVIQGENATFEDLQKLSKEGYIVALLISVDVPHYIIYLAQNPTHIWVHDPFFGEDICKEKRIFYSDKTIYPYYRWKIKASEFKKYLPDFDFTHKESNKGYIAFKK